MLGDFFDAFPLLARGCDPNASDRRGVWVHEIEPVACRIPDQDLRRAALGVHCTEMCMLFGVSVKIRKPWCESICIPSTLRLK
jgi:lipoate-protein ligase B